MSRHGSRAVKDRSLLSQRKCGDLERFVRDSCSHELSVFFGSNMNEKVRDKERERVRQNEREEHTCAYVCGGYL